MGMSSGLPYFGNDSCAMRPMATRQSINDKDKRNFMVAVSK